MIDEEQSPERHAPTVLRDDSDRLLRAVGELRALERAKRLQAMSSEPFYALARQLEAKAREVFRLAEEQDEDAAAVDHRPDAWSDAGVQTVGGSSPDDDQR